MCSGSAVMAMSAPASSWSRGACTGAVPARSGSCWSGCGAVEGGAAASFCSLRRPRRKSAVSCSAELWGESPPVLSIFKVPRRSWQASGGRHKAAVLRGVSFELGSDGCLPFSAVAGTRRLIAASGKAGVCKDLGGLLFFFSFSQGCSCKSLDLSALLDASSRCWRVSFL